MSLPPSRLFLIAALGLIAAGSEGCVAASVAGAAVGAAAKVTTTAVDVGAGAVGAAGKAVTGGSSSK